MPYRSVESFWRLESTSLRIVESLREFTSEVKTKLLGKLAAVLKEEKTPVNVCLLTYYPF
jgi:hypothetical protein